MLNIICKWHGQTHLGGLDFKLLEITGYYDSFPVNSYEYSTETEVPTQRIWPTANIYYCKVV